MTCEELKQKVLDARDALLQDPDNLDKQQALTFLTQMLSNEECLPTQQQIRLTPLHVCEKYGSVDAVGLSAEQPQIRANRVAFCQAATFDCPIKHISVNDFKASHIDFRKTFAEVLPYQPTFPCRTFAEVSDFIYTKTSTRNDEWGVRATALAIMLKRMSTMYNSQFTFDEKVEILRVLLGAYLKCNNNFIYYVFEACGQILNNIVLTDDRVFKWESLIVPRFQNRISFYKDDAYFEKNYFSVIKPLAPKIINAINTYPHFKESAFTQTELNTFVKTIADRFFIFFSASTPYVTPILRASAEGTLKVELTRGSNVDLSKIPRTDLTALFDITKKTPSLTSDDSTNVDVFSEGIAPVEETPPVEETKLVEETPNVSWYKTPLGLFGILVGVAGVGGTVYYFSKKK